MSALNLSPMYTKSVDNFVEISLNSGPKAL